MLSTYNQTQALVELENHLVICDIHSSSRVVRATAPAYFQEKLRAREK